MGRLRHAVDDLGRVIPRSVAALRADGAWTAREISGIRRLAEVAVDELALAGMTLTGSMGTLARPASEYEMVAAELDELGIERAHAAPSPLQPTRSVRKRVGNVSYDRIRFEHDPRLPESLAGLGLGGPVSAVMHTCRHDDGPRPCLVWVHGTGMGGPTDLLTSRAYRYFQRLGFNVVLPIQPGQGVRRKAWPQYPDVDPVVNLAGMMRTVSEVRAIVRWVRPHASSVTIAGLSLGTAVAALVSHFEPDVDAVALYVPILGLNQMLAQHRERWRAEGEEVGRVMGSDAVTRMTAVIDPVAVEPIAPARRRLIVGAWHDRMALRTPAEALHRKWGGEMFWHDGSHVGMLFAPEVTRVTERFLAGVRESAQQD